MQTLKESFKENQKKTNRRPTSSMRYPKQMPSYIVAFAVHETYDDIATAQQMICNKRSIQGSTSSVSPALSSKTITLEHSVPKILDTEPMETSSEVKINVDEVIDKNEDRNKIETPCEVKNSINEIVDKNEDINDNSNDEPPETKDYIVVDNREEEDMNRDDNIIVIESKHIKKQANRLLKKKHQNNCRIMNVNFKYKKTLKRGKKASKTPACAAKFKETFYSDSVSKVVSRTSLLKTVAAKENILEAVDSIFSDEDNNNDESIHSSPSTAKKSFISYSSDDTLTGKGSISSKNEDLSSLGTINSVIKIPPPIVTPYKTEVINVSVAVAYNPSSNDNAQDNLSAEPYRSIFDRDLLSTETLVRPALLLTSDSGSSAASENVPNAYMEGISIKNSSDGTLKPIINSENTFVVGNTSSEADDSMPSESTLTPNSEKFMYSENLRQTPPAIDNQEKERTHYNRAALLDTVINMGIFPKTNPSTSSAINYNDDLNNVFVTGDSDKYLKNAKYNDDQFTENPKDCTKLEFLNALKKSFDAYKETNILRNVNLPNESDIKAIINETDKFEAKFGTGELGNYPGNLAELWDRLVLVIDSAIRRLEQSLVEKIVTEIKKTLPIFEKQTTGIKEEIFDMEKMQGEGDTVISNKELGEKEEIQKEIDESLQCNLVGNQVIDDIMIKFSVEDPKAAISGVVTKSFPKVKRPKIFRDYFEVLKPPNVESSLVDGKGDTVTVSTASPSEIEEVASAQRVKSFLSGPMTFLWENMIVLTSVPSFLVMLLCIYGLIVLLMKPW